MAWNEPGGGGKDPWGGGNNGGPPDLDEAWKKFRDRLNGLFGGSGSGGDNNSGGGGFGSALPLIGIVLVVAAAIYFVLGFYVVNAKERAVVLRLGAFHAIKDAGLQWDPPMLSDVYLVNVTEERQYATQGLMLTEDESIVELPITVQYNVGDVRDFVLNVKNPEVSLRHAADSALRHVVGSSELQQVLSGGRAEIARNVKSRLQSYLDSYGSGIVVRDVNIQEGRPPKEVRDAFDDVIKAKEDQQRFKSEAQAYANAVIPRARGEAQRMAEEAQGYRDQVIARAEGQSRRFELMLEEYEQAPKVTRERLYIEAVEEVLTESSKVMVDVEGGNNMMYLPLDRLMQQSSGGSGARTGTTTNQTPTPSPEALRQSAERLRDVSRGSSDTPMRETR